MKNILSFASILFLCGSLTTFSQINNFSKYGQLIKVGFSTAPFPHSERINGHTYKKQKYPADVHYSDSSVAIFIPKNFNEKNKTDFVFYFHGWYNNIDTTLSNFQIIEQFYSSNKNAILIFPEGPRNSPDSFGGKFEDSSGFYNFMKELSGYLEKNNIIRSKEVGSIILSGHSGAYKIISSIIHSGGMTEKISEVYLFDALYDKLSIFTEWVLKSNGRFINIFTPDGGTRELSLLMIEDLTDWNTLPLLIEEDELDQSILAKNPVIFIDSQLNHNEVIYKNQQFYLFLKTSRLSDKTKKGN